jgi:dipeptidyl aminopeptidase/acylaminoacyl peptidase
VQRTVMVFSNPAARCPAHVAGHVRIGLLQRFILFLIVALSSQPAWPQSPPRLPVEAFATPQLHDNVRISPDGRYVAAKRIFQGKYVLIIYDLDNFGEKDPFILATDDEEVSWLEWANKDRLLVSIRMTGMRRLTPTMETRLIAINADGTDAKLLVKPKKMDRSDYVKVVQIQDRVVDFLSDDPNNILLSFNLDDVRRPRLYKVNVYNGRKKTIEKGREDVPTWHVDQQGRARIHVMIDDTDIRYFHRAPDSRKWDLLWEYEATSGVVRSPILFDKDHSNILYVFSNHAGSTIGVYRYDTTTNEFLDEVFRHELVDVARVRRGPKNSEIVSVVYHLDTKQVFWLDDVEKNIVEKVQQRLGADVIEIVSKSWNYERVVMLASSPSIPDRFYLYEPANDNLQYFAFTYPELDEAAMSKMSAVTYKARDGLEIPAYLSLPPGAGSPPQKPLPAIIFPHGGPSARDVARFDPWVQLLTNRGYAVLQMNFRGSKGYGREFLKSGFKQWGQAMQDDVTDGTRWLIAQGIADPEKICIYGGSYGGYAALMGAVLESGLYACAVSLNGVSDLIAVLEYQRRFLYSEFAGARIGDLWTDRAVLKENSPVNRADRISIPVLLAHGTNDRTVRFQQSDAMANALKKAGANYQYVKIKGADHGLTNGDHRLEFFSALDEFLAKHLD